MIFPSEPFQDCIDLSESSAPARAQSYSALSTLLVDDSLEKCVLQPYNHLFIPEYDGARRQNSSLAKWKEEYLASQEKLEGKASLPDEGVESEGTVTSVPEDKTTVGHEVQTETASAAETAKSSGKIKQGKKKASTAERRAKREELALQSNTEMDDMMLALVGILETVKYETNVGAWIRQGGLWAGFDEERESLSVEKKSHKTDAPVGNKASPSFPDNVRVDGSNPADKVDGTFSRSPRDECDSHMNDESSIPGLELNFALELESPGPSSENASRLPPRSSPSPRSDHLHTQSRSLDEILSAHRKSDARSSHPLIIPSALTGFVLRNSSTAAVSASVAGVPGLEATSSPVTLTPMWFNSSKVVNYWASKGRDVLKGLEIEVKDGIKPIAP
jgi:hypothetical protein